MLMICCLQVEVGKEKKARYHTYQRVALILALVFLVLALCIFSLRYLWSPSLGKVYDHQYKAVVDGVETDSMMEIDPGQRIEIFRMGNGSEEVLEVHDFKNGITGIRFAKHQRCYIRTQTRKLPTVTEVEAEDTELLTVGLLEGVEDSQVWVPIWEICQELPIHWIPSLPPKRNCSQSMNIFCLLLSDTELENVDTPDAEVTGQRFTREVLITFLDVGIELDNRLDERGFCCQHCRVICADCHALQLVDRSYAGEDL
uniref:Tenomodulin n=1 Tax=Sphaeramia orbicularis TaxID=375764 RepID=A0A673CGQ8_9TELE